MSPAFRSLHDAATRPFRGVGLGAWYSARGKLRFDPVFPALLKRGVLPDHGVLLDLGCGRGLLPALLIAARDQYLAGAWPADWPQPPLNLALHGVDLRTSVINVARQALKSRATFAQGDVRHIAFMPCSAIVILDVLLYLDESDQVALLKNAVAALDVNGVMVLREADAGAGFAFGMTKYAERFAAAVGGRGWQPLHYRRTEEWVSLLKSWGLSVTTAPMSAGTPFANVLMVARRRA